MIERPPPPPRMTWLAVARYVIEWFPEAVDGPFGTRLAAQREAAEAVGLQWTTLRNYLEAFRFSADLKEADTALATKLENQAIDVARCVARWAKWDRDGALTFLKSTPRPTTALALAAERNAKRARQMPEHASFVSDALQHLDRKLAGRPLPVLADHLVRLGFPPGETLALAHREPNPSSALFQFEQDQGVRDIWQFELGGGARPQPIEAIVMTTVRHSIPEGYRREAKSALFRAIALAIHRPLVILPFPTMEARQEFLNGRPVLPFENGEPSAIPAAGRDAASGRHISAEHIILPGAKLGAIIATTAEGLSDDLFRQ